jgi:hypothetical protein
VPLGRSPAGVALRSAPTNPNPTPPAPRPASNTSAVDRCGRGGGSMSPPRSAFSVPLRSLRRAGTHRGPRDREDAPSITLPPPRPQLTTLEVLLAGRGAGGVGCCGRARPGWKLSCFEDAL